MKKISLLFLLAATQMYAQGTWTPIASVPPDSCGGEMMLLTDGTVLCKTDAGGNDGVGNLWYRLTPDIHGSYVNGSWSPIAPMNDTRLYFSSQVLRSGKLYVAGGEYGTGTDHGEIYDPATDTWTMTPGVSTSGDDFSDANSVLLDGDKIVQALVTSAANGYNGNYIYDISSNTYSPGPTCVGSHDESAWVKLADKSIVFVDFGQQSSERYIPSLNQWVTDATCPVQLYDSYMGEMGAGLLLPDGRAFFFGATGHTAYYTPSGTISPGTWTVGPDIPNNLGTTDAAAAMMPNGKILCCASPQDDANGSFYNPMYFFEFNYLNNTFTPILAPDGTDSLDVACYYSNMLVLPNGDVLYASQGDAQYYVYSCNGAPLASGKPTIANIVQTNCHRYRVNGTLFNGISEGACYGDDWQMATNYPIVRLTVGSSVYYAKTTNWNSTGVMRGSLPDSTDFFVPMNVPDSTYQLQVIANGIASDPVSFTLSPCTGIQSFADENSVSVFPNPAQQSAVLSFSEIFGETKISVYNATGQLVFSGNKNLDAVNSTVQLDVSKWATGVYSVEIVSGKGRLVKRIVVQR